MRDATQQEFWDAGAPRPERPLGEEKAWIEHEGLWAAVILDPDREFAYVVLAPGPTPGIRAIYVDSGMRTLEAATDAARKALEKHAALGTRHDAGPPVTEREAAEILARATGTSVEEVLAGMADTRTPRPKN